MVLHFNVFLVYLCKHKYTENYGKSFSKLFEPFQTLQFDDSFSTIWIVFVSKPEFLLTDQNQTRAQVRPEQDMSSPHRVTWYSVMTRFITNGMSMVHADWRLNHDIRFKLQFLRSKRCQKLWNIDTPTTINVRKDDVFLMEEI